MLIKTKTRSDVGAENRLKVYEYFQENPDAMMKEAREDLGFSAPTLRGHVRAINEGWRPDE